MSGDSVDRRGFLKRAGAGVGGLTLLAGCTGTSDGSGGGTPTGTSTPTEASGGTPTGTATGTPTESEPSGTLNVATYSSFTGEGTAGNWLKSAFEERYPEVTVEFSTPENGVNQFIQRRQQGAPVDADLYVGLNTGELVRVDDRLDEALFAATADRVEGVDAVKEGLRIDPDGRAIPYDTGYISLVYDEDEVEPPGTFDALLEPEYEDDLITQNAQQSDPGRAFLLWTIIAKGEDGYLDYWSELADNSVRILSDWEPAYNAYLNEEAPMVVSYSTDQVYYHGEGVDTSRHQVGFLNDQGYANPEAMAAFADSDALELGRLFMEFVLTPEAQAEIAVRNVQFPAVEGVDPGEEFSKYAYEPAEPVTFTYDDLAGNVETWVDRWARQVVSG
jgi:thiamine transport system substrate-binding protein